jgi:hypothetical protein|tara:strand:+ start:13 stop:357 length:345 start_codon:yes stop_codon:yes gene_type:complete
MRDIDEINRKVKEKRLAKATRLRRHIEYGIVEGEILPNGVVRTTSPSGIQHWYDTRTLVEKVTAQMDRMEALYGRRECGINGIHQLQIRGKHLRRLLKKMPNVKQVGRKLIEKI